MINALAYTLVALMIAFVWYFIYQNYQGINENWYLEYDEEILSLQQEAKVGTWEQQEIQEKINEIKSQSFHSVDDIIELSAYYNDLGEIWKWVAVLENYLEQEDHQEYEDLSMVYHNLGVFYDSLCETWEKDEFCRNAIENFYELVENYNAFEYLPDIADIAWRMWEEQEASQILDYYEENYADQVEQMQQLQDEVEIEGEWVDPEDESEEVDLDDAVEMEYEPIEE